MNSRTQIMDSDSEDSTSDILDQRNEEGWEDLEDDTEAITVVSLFDDQTFSSAKEMLLYSKEKHDFDIWKIKTAYELEFLDLIKLVNYVRSQVKSGNANPDISSKAHFSDDKYLQPVLEDDALLYSLDDVFDQNPIDTAKTEIDQLREQLAQLTTQFQSYREEVQRSLLSDPESTAATANAATADPSSTSSAKPPSKPAVSSIDAGYFDSYSYNSIHELMLKDTIRTDTYRDFIYENKHLFAGKTILDVGCGTGILSLFCARAGAARVIAVDNSDIIHKARENVFRNKLDSIITCIRGKIEDVVLPVKQVDVIVSEWMGYCLLYESMLDSVLFARDRYLDPREGLMVPSHAVIKMAPLGDSDLRASHIDFWRHVYGFDMTAMLEKAHEEALIRTLQARELAGEATTVLELDLHTASVADLSFTAPFTLTWDPDSSEGASISKTGKDDDEPPEQHKNLEGFVLWFDTPFAPSPSPPSSSIPTSSAPTDSATSLSFSSSPAPPPHPAHRQKTPIKPSWLNLSTSPHTPPTHWQQGVLLIESEAVRFRLQKGDKISGTLEYRKKREEGSRGLDIEVRWSRDGDEGKGEGKQVWSLE